MIPSVDACYYLMDKYGMLDNIRAHSEVVAKVAHLLARSLAEAGVVISVEMVTAGALLHDIGKTASLREGTDHAELGRRICLRNHLPEIAAIVGEHVKLKNHTRNGNHTEKKVVYYADKRVKHDRIVDLDERLSYLLERYGRDNREVREAIGENFRICRIIEQELFRLLTFGPESLVRLAREEVVS